MKKSMMALAALAVLTACGGEEAPVAADTPSAGEAMVEGGMTAKAVIEARQQSLKSLGGAFKAINDQLKADAPDVAVISEAADKVAMLATDMPNWFPAGTGPDTGVKTDALPTIWSDPDGFAEARANFATAATNLLTAAEGGDVAMIAEAFKATGGACQTCHKSYRKDDD